MVELARGPPEGEPGMESESLGKLVARVPGTVFSAFASPWGQDSLFLGFLELGTVVMRRRGLTGRKRARNGY